MFVILFSGKFETNDHSKFMEGLKKLAKDTDTKIIGDFKFQEFVEFEAIEDSEVEILESNVEEKDNKTSDVSSGS